MPNIRIVTADLNNADHCQAIVTLLAEYAAEPAGGNTPIPRAARETLISGLRDHPTAFGLLALLEGEPVGVAICFVGYSTFAARKLVNIHDLAVSSQHRGQGVGRRLLAAIEQQARDLDCAKVTLEVYCDNDGARRLYRREGFGPPGKQTDFWVKPLS